MKKWWLLLFFLLSLGCKPSPKNLEFFLLHPEQIQPVFAQCHLTQTVGNFPASRECVAVLQAIPIINEYLNELALGRHTFGLRIMQAQLRLMKLKQLLESEQQHKMPNRDKIKELQQAIKNQDMIIQSRYAIIRFIREKR